MTPATTHSTTSALPGTSRLILVASTQYPRFSEADVIELPDGRLLLGVARKNGNSDFARGEIIGLFSLDGGVSWGDKPHVIQGTWGTITDVMSVSFCRSPRGLHLFFLARGADAKKDTQVYQIISPDDGRSWGEPTRVSLRDGYHIVNNARVIRLADGRIIMPAAYVPGDIGKLFNEQQLFCLYSDDDAKTWRESTTLALPGNPLMEPGIAVCPDHSIYMTIRTKLGELYEARSLDAGATWSPPTPAGLPSPEAPVTVFRDPASDNLWLFWCDRVGTGWKGRSRVVFASSRDNGKSWSERRPIEDDLRHSYGYTSVTVIRKQALLTYYDWADAGQPSFKMTNLRQRVIPRDWLDGHPVPPTFGKAESPVLTAGKPGEGAIVSMNSGLLMETDRWRAWYTNGRLGPTGEQLAVCFAESKDEGVQWTKPLTAGSDVLLPGPGDAASYYHASVHRAGAQLIVHTWRRASPTDSALYRYVSHDDGKSFQREPDHPLMASQNASDAVKASAGEGRISNDAFDVLQHPKGNWEYFAAHLEKAPDARAVIAYDNAAGSVRYIARATSPDGIRWSPTEVVIRPDGEDSPDTQFYGLQVMHYRGFYLGLLHTFHVAGQTIQPEWVWSHNGHNWARTRAPAIALGDEGAFDSRMILFGSLALTPTHLVYLYSGYNWRHNAFREGEVSATIGRATLPRTELDAWLATLPEA